MELKKILRVPNPTLKKVSEEVLPEDFGKSKQILYDMMHTMYCNNGVGISAIQIGIPLRLVVMDVSQNGDNPQFFINPKIINRSLEKTVTEEGCLSIPNFFYDIERPSECRVSYFDIDGNEVEKYFVGIEATCIQHEIDHLNGVVFIDYLSRLKRKLAVEKSLKG